ncbi:hypothetical protein ACFSQP_05715 [Bizionia sediminis]|uniref:Adhesin domain-containing protein n=1 Tax=Bizionia sediminis TaxID=1737064 RepID=A0ABW5KR84_9FLAO
MQRLIDASKISTIDITGTTIFKITLQTQPVQTVAINVLVEGEHNEQIVLKTQQKNDTLFVGTAYQPLFVRPDDKLAANKKISIELHLEIPENLVVTVFSDIGSVSANGSYKYLTAELLNGHFVAQQFTGSLHVDTLHGNIQLETTAGNVKAHSKKGLVTSETIPNGNNNIELNSVGGNITVSKTLK